MYSEHRKDRDTETNVDGDTDTDTNTDTNAYTDPIVWIFLRRSW